MGSSQKTYLMISNYFLEMYQIIRFQRDVSSVLSLTNLCIVIARSIYDAAISKRDSFASLGMTTVKLIVGQDTSVIF